MHHEHPTAESDVAADEHLARTRETGGVEQEGGIRPEDPQAEQDRTSTTGTGETEEFVGRVGGDDPGYAGETGAEKRAQEAGS